MNFNSQGLDDLAARIRKAIDASPAKDIEKNIKSMLQSGLQRLDVVTREEFDTQSQVLLRTREKLERLEARLTAMEHRAASSGSGDSSGTGATLPDPETPPPMGPAE